MNSFRRALVDRRQIRTVVWLASLAGMAVGLLFALEGVWVAAVPCVGVAGGAMWLVGVWVLPWTRDAHLRRVLRIWRTWAAETQWANAEATRNRGKFVNRLVAIDPPDELRAQHEHLVSLAEEHDRLGRQWPRTPAPLSEGAAVQRAEREEKEKLIAEASLDAHRSYAVELDRLLTTAREEFAHAAARYEDATERALRRLAQMTPPSSAHAEHALLTAGFEEHLGAARRFHAALRMVDPKNVAATAADWEKSLTSLRVLVASLGEQLEHDQRWPVPVPGRSASEPKRD